jgi:RNA polymerase sigma-70 factor (ECF subfamily)
MATLFDLLGRRAFGLAYRVLRDAAPAEDVVQAAFLTVWQQAHSFGRPGARIEPFLLAVTYRHAIDMLRAQRDQEPRHWPAEPVPGGDSEDLPVEAADVSHQRAAVRKAVDDLPEEQKDALEAAYYRGRTVTEISAAFEVTPREINANLGRALTSVWTAMQ